MLYLFLLVTYTFGFNTKHYQQKMITFVDIGSECYKNTVNVMTEFQMLNNIIVEQIVPKYENSIEPTEIKEFIDFIQEYNLTIHILNNTLYDKYINNERVKEESKYVIRVVVDILNDISRFIAQLLKSKTTELIQIEFSNHLNEYIANNTQMLMDLINTTMTMNSYSNFMELYSIEFDNFINDIPKWMIEYINVDKQTFEDYKSKINFTDRIIDKLINDKLVQN